MFYFRKFEYFTAETIREMRDIYLEIFRSILSIISKDGYFTIKEVADDCGYSITTVAKYVKKQKERGTFDEIKTQDTPGRGRKSIIYGLGPKKSIYIGVDVLAFELNIGAMSVSGTMIKIQSDKNFRLENTYGSLENICAEVLKFISSQNEFSFEDIAAIGFSLSGRVNSEKGTSASILNLEETSETPLADFLTEKLGVQVFIWNDTKAMAYGEYMSYYQEKYSDIVFVNFGWGLGMGLIFDGNLYYGKDGYAGEFGHMHTYDNNILCRCGKKGCLETEVSGIAISRKLTERISHGVTSVLTPKVRKGETINTGDILEAISKEDALCIDLISKAGTELGNRLAGIMNVLNPELIVIGGSLSVIEPYYFQQYVALGIRQYSLKLLSNDVQIVKSKLGNEAAVIGTCMLARSRVLEKENN